MNLPAALLDLKTTWLRRVLLFPYLPLGIVYNIVWHGPKMTVVQAVQFCRLVWAHRE